MRRKTNTAVDAFYEYLKEHVSFFLELEMILLIDIL